MKHSSMTAASSAAVWTLLATSAPLAGIVVSLPGALPARGGEVPFTERVISTTADGAHSVFATDVDGDGDTDVLSASGADDKIAWYENTTPPPIPTVSAWGMAAMVMLLLAGGAVVFRGRRVTGDGAACGGTA